MGLIALIFGASVFLLRYLETIERNEFVEEDYGRRSAALENWISLKGDSLRQFAYDYSQWDEMLQFVEHPVREWAVANIDDSLVNFAAQACWVYTSQGMPVYSVNRLNAPDVPLPPMSNPSFMTILREKRFLHFYGRCASGLLEFRVAPIQASSDSTRMTAPRGWLVIARLWTSEYLGSLGTLTDSQAYLYLPNEVPESGSNQIFCSKTLGDWAGAPVMTLRIRFNAARRDIGMVFDWMELSVFLLFGLLLFTTLYAGLKTWVLSPLSELGNAMASGEGSKLRGMVTRDSAFFGVSELIDSAAEQKRHLEREVVERRKVEETLLASQEELRASIRGKEELERNLHDGVVQSLYAAGLALSSVSGLMEKDRVRAKQQLEAVRDALNDVIRELRGYLSGLDPAMGEEVSFDEAVRRVLDSLGAGHAFRPVVDLPMDIVGLLPIRIRAQLLLILKEAASNALRHGRASELRVSLKRAGEAVEFVVSDNGSGISSSMAAELEGGLGMANLNARAESIGASLKISSTPHTGVEVVLVIPLSQIA